MKRYHFTFKHGKWHVLDNESGLQTEGKTVREAWDMVNSWQRCILAFIEEDERNAEAWWKNFIKNSGES